MRNPRIAKLHTPSAVATLAFGLVLALTGCMGGAAGGSDGGTGSDGGMSVSVTEPDADATVSVPFTVTVDSSVPLGPTGSGEHHVHIWFDDNSDDYLVVESNTTKISELASGEHTMHVSLRNADHSPAGAETEVPITVGNSPGKPGNTPAEPDDPYDY